METVIKIGKILLFVILAPIMVFGMILSIFVPNWMKLLEL
jgi:hypothetical protein